VHELEPGGGAVGSRAQPYFERFGCRGGAVLGLEEEALVVMAQIQGAVGPGVEVAGAAQGLPGIGGGVLSHVMDDDDGEVVSALELAQEGEELGDLAGVIFVSAVQSHEGVEEQESGSEAFDGFGETLLVALEVET
jgi:hypothetical protein